MLALIGIQGIEGVGIDLGLEAILVVMPVTLGVVGQRQQIVALDSALGEKCNLGVVEVTILEAGIAGRDLIVR